MFISSVVSAAMMPRYLNQIKNGPKELVKIVLQVLKYLLLKRIHRIKVKNFINVNHVYYLNGFNLI